MTDHSIDNGMLDAIATTIFDASTDAAKIHVPEKYPRLRILRSLSLFGKNKPAAAYPLSAKNEDVVLSRAEQTLYERLTHGNLFGQSGRFELARKGLVRTLLRDGYAVPDRHNPRHVLVVYNNNHTTSTDLINDITGLKLPADSEAEEVLSGRVALTHFAYKSCRALFASLYKPEIPVTGEFMGFTLDQNQAAYYFFRATGSGMIDFVDGQEPALLLHSAYLLKSFGPDYGPMAAIAGQIPQEIMQAAQAETVCQLIDAFRMVQDEIALPASTQRIENRLKTIRAGMLKPSEAAWDLRREAVRAVHEGLDLNDPMKMLPVVGSLLEGHINSFDIAVPPQVCTLIAEGLSPGGSAELDAISNEKLFFYLPTMLLAHYGLAAKQLLGPRAAGLLSSEAEAIIATLTKPGRENGKDTFNITFNPEP